MITVKPVIAKILRNITPFRLLYWGTAVATFRHSALGFATVEGSVFWGALSAIAVDIAMLLAAERLRDSHNRWLIAGLVVASLASVYSQSLYMVTHAAAVEIAPGALWMSNVAQTLIDLRVVIIPLLLPAQVVIFALASHYQQTEGVFEPQSKKDWCQAIFRLLPKASPTQVAAVVSSHLGEEVSVATASRAK